MYSHHLSPLSSDDGSTATGARELREIEHQSCVGAFLTFVPSLVSILLFQFIDIK